ncbi:MAG: alpha/beta hydrolase [Opitutus sp.]
MTILLVVVYGAASLTAWIVSNRIIFLPDYASRAEAPGTFYLKMSDGTKVGAVHLRNTQARFTLWYFHGNAESLDDVMPRLIELRDLGFSVFALEYPGYATSEGSPSESSLNASTAEGFDYLREHGVASELLVLFGRSLGSGPAVELASHHRFAGLILESAFMSVYRVVTHWPVLLGDRFNNVRKIRGIGCPTLLIHGRDDHTIPFYHGEGLEGASAAVIKRRLWIQFAGHNDVRRWAGDSYVETVRSFLAELR